MGVYSQIIVGRLGFLYKIYFKRSNEEVFPAEVSSSMFMLRGERMIQGVVRDITERKKAEKKLKQTMEELKRSNKELEQFAYVASHGRLKKSGFFKHGSKAGASSVLIRYFAALTSCRRTILDFGGSIQLE